MAIGLAHVGEFAFVLVLLGYEAGVISEEEYQMVITLAIGSLILTPMLLKTGLRWTQPESVSDVEPAIMIDRCSASDPSPSLPIPISAKPRWTSIQACDQ